MVNKNLIPIGHGIRDLLVTLPSPSGGMLRAYSFDEVPMSFNEFPVAIILPGSIDYHADFQADIDLVFRIIVLTEAPDQASALSQLLPFTDISGSYSLNALFGLAKPQTLGGTADDAHLTKNLGIGSTIWGAPVPFLSTEFELLVWA